MELISLLNKSFNRKSQDLATIDLICRYKFQYAAWEKLSQSFDKKRNVCTGLIFFIAQTKIKINTGFHHKSIHRASFISSWLSQANCLVLPPFTPFDWLAKLSSCKRQFAHSGVDLLNANVHCTFTWNSLCKVDLKPNFRIIKKNTFAF